MQSDIESSRVGYSGDSNPGTAHDPSFTDCASASLSTLSLASLNINDDTLEERLTAALPICSRLTALDMQSNVITALPTHILLHLGSLTVLDVSRNRLQMIPREISALVQLRDLCALSNHLRPPARSLPLPELRSLAFLQQIDLRYNKKLCGARGDACVALFKLHVPKLTCIVTGSEQQKKTTEPRESAADRDACSLRGQLEPISTPQLRKRLKIDFGCDTDIAVDDREAVMDKLLQSYENEGPRRRVLYQGRALDLALALQLEEALKQTEWHDKHERNSVLASGYFTIKRARAARGPHAHLWHVASLALASVVGSESEREFEANVSALAVSKNFQGSPHIDAHDRDIQFAFSCGDYGRGLDSAAGEQGAPCMPAASSSTPTYSISSSTACTAATNTAKVSASAGSSSSTLERGGRLCVELNARQVAEVDTYQKMAKVDGRFPHWVSPYRHDRYSIIWFRTQGPTVPPTVPVFPTLASP